MSVPILPTKHTPVSRSLLGVGAVLLRLLREPATVSRLWEAARDEPAVGSYQRFLLGLDLLFLLGAVELRAGRLRRAGP